MRKNSEMVKLEDPIEKIAIKGCNCCTFITEDSSRKRNGWHV